MRSHLASLVEDFRRHGAETAVVDHRGNRRFRTTYGELAKLAARFSAELEQRQISPGERVVLWGSNSAEWIGVFFGCLLRGVIVVPLDAAGTPDFSERVLKDVSPKLIVGEQTLLRSLKTDIPLLFLAEITKQLSADELFAVSDSVGVEAPFQIVFTSGTTSEPKGIVHTHRNVLSSLQPIENEIAKYRKYLRWVHPLRFFQSVPMSHVFGQFMGLWIPSLLAAELHFADQYDPARTAELIRSERISVLVAVPRVLQLLRTYLLNRFESVSKELDRAKNLSIWKRWWYFRQVHRALGWKFWAAISGGASLPPELEAFWNGMGFALIQGYGLTETTALVTLNHPFHIGQGTIGKVLPGREVRVGDDGEILVRGAMLATATWQNGAIRPREGEWLATGDIATQDTSGELRFLGRKGDVFVTSAGLNIHPGDLEAAIAKQPGVRGCVVIPYRMPNGVEPVAVVLFSGSEQEMTGAVRDANDTLAQYQKIRRVLRWPQPQFPYTSTGKLLRRKVEQWACLAIEQQRGRTSQQRDETDVLLSMIEEVTGEHLSSGPDNLRLSEDLHLDSLGRVQLQTTLEQKFNIEIDDDAILASQTLGELRAMLGIRSYESSVSDASIGVDQVSEDAAVTTESATTATPFQEKKPSLAHRYPRWPWFWLIRILRIAFIEAVLRPLVWMIAAPRVVKPEKELPSRPVLVIANHVTSYDGALILYAVPGRLRRAMAIAMSGEMLLDFRSGKNQRSAIRNVLAPTAYLLVTALFNVFPLPRMRGFRKSFAYAGEAMDHGYSVLIFPEGTRSRDGKLQAFRPGIGMLAGESEVPIVPIALIGLGDTHTKKTRWPRSNNLEIRIGDAVKISEREDPAGLTDKLEQIIRKLQTEDLRQHS